MGDDSIDIIVGIGEYAISDNKDDILKTYTLGSCIAIVIYSPKKMVAGIAHIALPCSSVDFERSKYQPAHFVDTAVPLLLSKMYKVYGCKACELTIYIYGGAESIQKNDVFRIGKRNIEAVTNILLQNGLPYHTMDIGGFCSRNVEVAVATGIPKVYLYLMNSTV